MGRGDLGSRAQVRVPSSPGAGPLEHTKADFVRGRPMSACGEVDIAIRERPELKLEEEPTWACKHGRALLRSGAAGYGRLS